MNGEGVESDHLRPARDVRRGNAGRGERERPDAERKSRQIGGHNMELAPRDERPKGSSKKSAASVSSLQQSALAFVGLNYWQGFQELSLYFGCKKGALCCPGVDSVAHPVIRPLDVAAPPKEPAAPRPRITS